MQNKHNKLDKKIVSFLYIVLFFLFGYTSQEQERKDLVEFLTMTTNIIQGIIAVYK